MSIFRNRCLIPPDRGGMEINMIHADAIDYVLFADKPHDAFAKALLSIEGVAGIVLKEHFPLGNAADLRWESARLVDTAFVSQRLRRSAGDVVLRVELEGDSSRVVFVLIEAKSRPDRWVGVQGLRYTARLVERWRVQEGRRCKFLPEVIVVVLYNGRPRWTVPLTYAELVGRGRRGKGGGLPRVRSLDFEYLLVNLAELPEEEMPSDAEARAGLLALKYGCSPRRQQHEAIPRILRALSKAPLVRPYALSYIWRTYKVDDEYLLSQIEEIIPEDKETSMTIYKRCLARGEARGEARGRAEGGAKAFAQSIVCMMRKQFGSVPADVVHRIRCTDESQLDAWADRVFAATSLEEVFAGSPA